MKMGFLEYYYYDTSIGRRTAGVETYHLVDVESLADRLPM
ncbi:3323_t:CDS:2 [Diversispora eburnea]|uniref:3323_t:CDS:1 n=1 Tax=Diversispora eburnea TaxID=1213867 RepID=A0A9N9AT60_9GLOM|nr:3323_t:CDS:2 [Diversispora eburnea]